MGRAGTSRRGFSLPELLVVLAVLGLAVVVAVPLVANQVRLVQVRSAADQLAANLRAARTIAVSIRRPVDVRVDVDPDNRYTFPDARGRTRIVRLPEGIRISSSTSPISFRPDGSLPGGAVTVLETVARDGMWERWVVRTGLLGVPRTTHERLIVEGGAR